MLFREHVLSDVLSHLHNKNDNAHKLFFTSSQNSTFSLGACYHIIHFCNVGVWLLLWIVFLIFVLT